MPQDEKFDLAAAKKALKGHETVLRESGDVSNMPRENIDHILKNVEAIYKHGHSLDMRKYPLASIVVANEVVRLWLKDEGDLSLLEADNPMHFDLTMQILKVWRAIRGNAIETLDEYEKKFTESSRFFTLQGEDAVKLADSLEIFCKISPRIDVYATIANGMARYMLDEEGDMVKLAGPFPHFKRVYSAFDAALGQYYVATREKPYSIEGAVVSIPLRNLKLH